MKQALDFLKSNKDIALATVGLNGRPMIRAFQIMKADGNTLYFATNPRKAIWQELQTNPAIELLALKGNISVRVGGDVSSVSLMTCSRKSTIPTPCFSVCIPIIVP